MKRSEIDWKKKLTPEQYEVLRQKATETPYSGELLYNDKAGIYNCAACGADLFKSESKFNANCGWPSFNNVIDNNAVELKKDSLYGLRRVEVLCKKCGSHLGHVFNDAPSQPTGIRFCINSVALNFNLSGKRSAVKNEIRNRQK